MAPGQTEAQHKFLNALLAIENMDKAAAAAEQRAVFAVVGKGVGGPDGELPIHAASFAVSPLAARLMDELAAAMQGAGVQCTLACPPRCFGSDMPSRTQAQIAMMQSSAARAFLQQRQGLVMWNVSWGGSRPHDSGGEEKGGKNLCG